MEGNTERIDVSEHPTLPSLIRTCPDIDVLPSPKAVAVVTWGDEESELGATVATCVFEDAKDTRFTEQSEDMLETDIEKGVDLPVVKVAKLGVRLAVQVHGLSVGVGVSVGIGGGS